MQSSPIDTADVPKAVPELGDDNDNLHFSTGGVYIQAGAFAVRDNADNVARQLSVFGSPQVIPVSINNMVLYRVRLGPMASREEANHVLGQMVNSGHMGATIVAN